MSLIEQKKSVIVACDVATIEELARLVEETACVKGIGAYKVGAILAMKYALRTVVLIVKNYTDLPVIYDHQKGGTDIPPLGGPFVEAVVSAEVDALILFPFGGAATEKVWIEACQDNELTVLIGGHMTQPKFLERDGGFIADGAPGKIYEFAARLGVEDFVVPGNQPELVARYRAKIARIIGRDPTLYAPGFISQGGDISYAARVAGENWHAIVGSAIYRAEDPRKAAEQVTRQIAT